MCAPLPIGLLINGLGQRVKKTVGTTVTLYHYDEGGKLLGEYNSTGTALYETIYLDDQPVAVIKPGTSATTYKAYYLYADHLNTPRLITDNAAGTANKKVWQWDSDPFGASVPNENPAAAGVFTYNQRFPGQVYDKETGLHYNYFRDYNPATGRYVQSDPIGLAGGMNTYGYVKANPLSGVDPRGLIKWSGTYFSVGSPILKSATYDTYTLTSECVNGYVTNIRIRAYGFGVGLGGTFAGGFASFDDGYSYINPEAFVGEYYKYAAGFAAGVGYGYSRVALGGVQSSGWGVEGGFDYSAGLVVGKTEIVWERHIPCDCNK
jgi:RHS repeat-associated protein